MANATGGENAAIAQGQTTSPGENAQATQTAPTLEGETAAKPQESIFSSWLLWVVVAIWLWIIFGNKKKKAQREQEKKDRERRENLQRGDKIVTIGRMHGKVVSFTDKTVTITPDEKSDYTMTFDREALLRVLPRPGEEAETAAADAAVGGVKE